MCLRRALAPAGLGLVLGAGLLAAPGLPAAPSAAACRDVTAAPSARWRLARLGGRAWFVTPCGDRFFSIGVDAVDGGESMRGLGRPHYAWQQFAPDLGAWAREARARLTRWGFNTAGAWSLPPGRLRLPAAINLDLGRTARIIWGDPFDPRKPALVRALARRLTAPYRGSPYRIGYFSDNEVGWWGGALFRYYAAQPAGNYTKRRWVALLRERYRGDFGRFARDFAPPAGVRSWDALLRTRRATRLRPGTRGIEAVEQWTGVVADRYYALAAAAIHAADPDALYLGDRLPIYYDPAALRAAARHADVVSTNYDVDSPEGWVAPYYFDGMRALTGAKPVLVSEWFYAARENRTGNRNIGQLMTVDTQAERARGAAAAAAAFARVPEVVGVHWFQYYDEPRGGRADGEDYDFGLVDTRNRPYVDLVRALSAANRALPGIHAGRGAAERAAPRASPRTFVIPRARIDWTRRSLADWPKPASLLPPLRGPAGAVAFGEAYLTWSGEGLALATIGQDYDDPDLLLYAGGYPLREAYRVELDGDLGGGPRRFTLYMVPRRAGARVSLAPLVCLGAPAQHERAACAAVPGARAVYLGLGQPRVAAEVLIPWAAFGRAGPPPGGRVAVEVALTAWHRARWISLSGLPPEMAAAHPERWTAMRVGVGEAGTK